MRSARTGDKKHRAVGPKARQVMMNTSSRLIRPATLLIDAKDFYRSARHRRRRHRKGLREWCVIHKQQRLSSVACECVSGKLQVMKTFTLFFTIYSAAAVLILIPVVRAVYLCCVIPGFEHIELSWNGMTLHFGLPGVPGGRFTFVSFWFAYVGFLLVVCTFIVQNARS